MKNKFKVKFGTVFYVLFALIYVLAAVCLVWNAIKVIDYIKTGISASAYGYISLGLSLLLSVIFIILITMVLTSSSYVISDSKMTVSFGILKETFLISDIASVVKNVKRPSLSVLFQDGSGYKIMIDEKSFDDFYAALVKYNKDITFGEIDEETKK